MKTQKPQRKRDMQERIKIGNPNPKASEIAEKYKKIIQKELPKAKIILFGSNAVPMKGQSEELDIFVIVKDQNKALPAMAKLFPDYQCWEDKIYLYDYRFGIEAEFHLVSEGHYKIKRALNLIERLRKDKKLKTAMEKFKESCNGQTKEEYYKKKQNFYTKHDLSGKGEA